MKEGSYTELFRVRSFVCITVSSVDALWHLLNATSAWELWTVSFSEPRIMDPRFARFENPLNDQQLVKIVPDKKGLS